MKDDRVLEFPARPGGVSEEVVHAVDALLFAAGAPVTEAALADALEVAPEVVRAALDVLGPRREHGGVELVRVAGGWQLRTAPRFGERVRRLRGSRARRLSPVALEVLSVVAYRQPVTRREIDEVRGVASGHLLRRLVEAGVVRVAGRRASPGKPLEYRTTSAFLTSFGLRSLEDLPTLAELEELGEPRAGGSKGEPGSIPG